MTRAVVAFGSNIAPEENIAAALDRLGRDHRVLSVSPILRTSPIGPVADQPVFHNGAALVATAVGRAAFTAALKAIEVDLGRRPGGDRWGPRTMDLDLVVWDGRIVEDDVHRRDWLAASVVAVLGDLPASAP